MELAFPADGEDRLGKMAADEKTSLKKPTVLVLSARETKKA